MKPDATNQGCHKRLYLQGGEGCLSFCLPTIAVLKPALKTGPNGSKRRHHLHTPLAELILTRTLHAFQCTSRLESFSNIIREGPRSLPAPKTTSLRSGMKLESVGGGFHFQKLIHPPKKKSAWSLRLESSSPTAVWPPKRSSFRTSFFS